MLQYTVFDQLKQRMLKEKQSIGDKGSSPKALSAFSAFVLGAVAKSIATVITYPAIRCLIVLSDSIKGYKLDVWSQLKYILSAGVRS